MLHRRGPAGCCRIDSKIDFATTSGPDAAIWPNILCGGNSAWRFCHSPPGHHDAPSLLYELNEVRGGCRTSHLTGLIHLLAPSRSVSGSGPDPSSADTM